MYIQANLSLLLHWHGLLKDFSDQMIGRMPKIYPLIKLQLKVYSK